MIGDVQVEPLADKLRDLDIESEVIAQHKFQGDCRARPMCEVPGVVQEGFVRQLLPLSQMRGAVTDQAIQAGGKLILAVLFCLALELDIETILSPRAVEERSGSVIEDVEQMNKIEEYSGTYQLALQPSFQ